MTAHFLCEKTACQPGQAARDKTGQPQKVAPASDPGPAGAGPAPPSCSPELPACASSQLSPAEPAGGTAENECVRGRAQRLSRLRCPPTPRQSRGGPALRTCALGSAAARGQPGRCACVAWCLPRECRLIFIHCNSQKK